MADTRLSYVLVQLTVNIPLVPVKLLQATNGNPDLYSYSCLRERSLRLGMLTWVTWQVTLSDLTQRT